jgi:hypothetical protein
MYKACVAGQPSMVGSSVRVLHTGLFLRSLMILSNITHGRVSRTGICYAFYPKF